MQRLLWVTMLICLVVLPLFAYVCWKIYVVCQISSLRLYTQTILKYVQTLPPFDTSPIPCKIYYINLDRSPDRKLLVEKQARELHLDCIRVPAVDGKQIKGSKESGIIDGITYRNDFTNLTLSELACTLSHVKAIRTAYDENQQVALICEDDVSFELAKLWPEGIIQILIDKMPKNMGILQLFWNTNGYMRTKTSCQYESFYTVKQHRQGGNCWSAVAYLITRKGMQDVLQHSRFTSGRVIHLNKTPHVHFGYADGYIYQCTTSGHSGIPLVLPNVGQLKSTQFDRPSDEANDVAAIRLSNIVLKKHATKRFAYKKHPKEETYRLSDAYNGNYRPIWTRNYHKKWYPNTIMGQYFEQTNRFKRFGTLIKVIQQNRDTMTQTPPNDGAVIHLRLGDTIEYCGHSVDAHLAKELPYTEMPTNPRIWVHSKGYYDQQLARFPHVKKIELVYGKHRTGKDEGFSVELTKTKEYVTKLTAHFKSKGYDVKIHESDFDPDQDFLYMCYAPYLIAGGGSGYANLAMKVNQYLKNKLI